MVYVFCHTAKIKVRVSKQKLNLSRPEVRLHEFHLTPSTKGSTKGDHGVCIPPDADGKGEESMPSGEYAYLTTAASNTGESKKPYAFFRQ